jgi:hypothetical protein
VPTAMSIQKSMNARRIKKTIQEFRTVILCALYTGIILLDRLQPLPG